ncbi:hypothetical protein D3C72_1214170 [compost metagenome]
MQRQLAAVAVVVQVGVHVDAQVRGQEVDGALVDLDQADGGHGAGVGGVLAEGPGATPVGFHLQADGGRGQRQARNDHPLVDQRPQADLEARALGLHQVGVARPVGVGEFDAVEVDGGGLPAQVHVEPAGDLELAPGLLTHEAVERLAQRVPRKEGHEERERGQQDGDQQHEGRQQLLPARPGAKGLGCHGRFLPGCAPEPGRRRAADPVRLGLRAGARRRGDRRLHMRQNPPTTRGP